MSGLEVRQDDCALDFLYLGALVHRLGPGTTPFRRARAFDIHVAGTAIVGKAFERPSSSTTEPMKREPCLNRVISTGRKS